MDHGPATEVTFDALESPFNDGPALRALKNDFIDWVYRSAEIQVRVNQKLGVYAGPDGSQAEFRRACAEAARRGLESEIQKIEATYEKKLDAIEGRLRREERELRQDEADLSQRRVEEYGTHAENVLSIFSRRSRRLSTSLTKRRMTEQAKARVEESEDAIEDFKEQISQLEGEFERAVEDVKSKWSDVADDLELISIHPYKKDILMDLFGVAWMPYHLVEADGQVLELPGFGPT